MQRGRGSLAAVSLLVGMARIAGAGGELDPSFGANGIATLASGPWGDRFVGNAATRTLDPANADAVVVVGVAPAIGVLASYGAAVAATGSLIGASSLPLDTEVSNFGVFYRILADPTDPSHRLYAVGTQYTEGAAPPYSFLVARLSPLGDALDPTWGGGAPVITAVAGTTQATASVLGVQPDGKLLVAGRASADLDDANDDVAIVRYDTDGNVDPAFGTAGATVIPSSIVRGLAVQSDGKILLSGFFTDGPFAGFGIVRLLPDGAIDPSFGAAFGAPGIATTAFRSRYTDGFATSVAVLPDGRIVAAGSDWDPYGRRGSFVAARFLADGTLDSTFSKRGKIGKRVGKSNVAGAIAFLPDGKVLIAGTARRKHPEHHTDIALLRLDANGKPDRSFGRGGRVQTPIVPDWEGFAVREVIVDSFGRTTVVGVSADGAGKATILARYLP